MCDALHYLLDNIFIRFGSKLYRQIVGIPMGTNWVVVVFPDHIHLLFSANFCKRSAVLAQTDFCVHG